MKLGRRAQQEIALADLGARDHPLAIEAQSVATVPFVTHDIAIFNHAASLAIPAVMAPAAIILCLCSQLNRFTVVLYRLSACAGPKRRARF